MAFSLETWRGQVGERLQGLGAWLERRRDKEAPYLLYGTLCSMTLWPLIEAARQPGGYVAVIGALSGVAGGMGADLLAEQVGRWKDKAGEGDVNEWVAEHAPAAPDLREALDAVLERLDTIPQARAALDEPDQQWFSQTLREELTNLGSLTLLESSGRGVTIGGNLAHGIVSTGDNAQILFVTAEAAAALSQQFVAPQRLSADDLLHATERYLRHLVDRYLYLNFRGMGVSDRVPLRLPLVEMYVPLKARIELPGGETWDRVRLAGRFASEEEAEAMGRHLSEPTPLLDLLQDHSGLIVLGDPGAGKTTFLKYLTLRLALGEGEALGLGARLPVLVPLSAYASALAERDVPLDGFVARYYDDLGANLPVKEMLDEALAQGKVLLLLDGLDEVKDQARRRLVVDRVVDFFLFAKAKGNKFLLTSRVVGYREVRPVAEGLGECTLVGFDEDDIADFLEKWTGALERAARGDTDVAVEEAERERRELQEAVNRNQGVRRLASNPLLLTILALMKRQGVTLPERRVELYQNYVETLLKNWNLARGLGRPPTRDLDVVETVRVLAPLALWMHETSPGVGLVKRGDLQRELERICAGRGGDDPGGRPGNSWTMSTTTPGCCWSAAPECMGSCT